jgi:hypothetical protein
LRLLEALRLWVQDVDFVPGVLERKYPHAARE